MADNVLELGIRSELGPGGGWKSGALGAVEADKKIKALEKRVNTDPLTGLDGEYPLQDMINGLEERWVEESHKGKILEGIFVILDLDGLHFINHKYGKVNGGNDFLRNVADELKEIARGRGRCFRSGTEADELVLYLPGSKTKAEVESILDKIDADLNKRQEKAQRRYPGIKFGVSYSVSAFHQGYGPKKAYKDANNKMGEAKHSETGTRVGNVGRIFVNDLMSENKRHE